MMKFIDKYLNVTTMYRLILYYLAGLWVVAMIMSIVGVLPYSSGLLLLSGIYTLLICWLTNKAFEYAFESQINVESAYITAFILVLIITPPTSFNDMRFLSLAGWASVLAIASKYIIAFRRKHIFNPAAFGVAITALALHQSASWWIGAATMLPFVVVGGLLVVRKIIRSDMVLTFGVVALMTMMTFGMTKGIDPISMLTKGLFETSLFFFAFVMITEPLTTPPTKGMQIIYGGIVGFLFAPFIHIGSVYSTPELALLMGNIFSYIVSPKQKLLLVLKDKLLIAQDTYDFVFNSSEQMKFRPGQYMEWTLGHEKPDTRGNRRYFTIASSPTEQEIRMGVKYYPNPSTYKQELATLEKGDTVMAGQLAGDFTLPDDTNKKLVMIAGGIGITPFRSMIKYLIDTKEKRDVVLMYSNRTAEDIAYKDVFDAAATAPLNLKTIYTITDLTKIPANWKGKTGMITGEMIAQEIPDYAQRIFYISGPRGMIDAFEDALGKMGVPSSNIITDFFPGFA